MRYKINDKIIFDMLSSSVEHIETQDSVILSLSQSHLLRVIITSGSEILPKDKIISDLWNHHGISVSGNTLNQSLSVFRRILAGFECDNFIITIPRVGIRVNPDIAIQVLDVTPSHASLYDKKTTWSRFGKKTVVGFIFIFIFCVIYSYELYSVFPIYNKSIIKGCVVNNVQNMGHNEKQQEEKEIIKILKENNLICNDKRVIFFDRYRMLSDENYGRTLLSYCTLNDSDVIVMCDNYYYRNWRVN